MIVVPGAGFCDQQIPVLSTIGRGPRGPQGPKGDAIYAKYANPIQWDITRSYQENVVVIDNGSSYISLCPVPHGVQITDTDYWQKIGDSNAQVQYLTQEMMQQAFAFDTVAEMKACEFLFDGAICHTNGFHYSGDGGGAWYKVFNNGPANEMDVIALQNDLYASIVLSHEMSPAQFGAHRDASVDAAGVLMRMTELYLIIKDTGTYLVNDVVTIPAGQTLRMRDVTITSPAGKTTRGFTMRGNLDIERVTTDGIGSNVFVFESNNCVVRADHCEFKNQKIGDATVSLNRTSKGAIFFVQKTGWDVRITNCECHHCEGLGLTQLLYGGHAYICDNHIHDNMCNGVHVYGGATWYDDPDNKVDGYICRNHIENIGLTLPASVLFDEGQGIFCQYGYDLYIDDNIIRNCSANGIEADAASMSHNIISNCGCRYDEVEPSNGEGIYWGCSFDRPTRICDNKISGCYGYGIRMVKTVTDRVTKRAIISGNEITGLNGGANPIYAIGLVNASSSAELDQEYILANNMSEHRIQIYRIFVVSDLSVPFQDSIRGYLKHNCGILNPNGMTTTHATLTITNTGFRLEAEAGYIGELNICSMSAEQWGIFKARTDVTGIILSVGGENLSASNASDYCVAISPDYSGRVKLYIPKDSTVNFDYISIDLT